MPSYYNWFQFNGAVQVTALRSLAHPHRLMCLSYFQVTESLFHGFSFSQIIKSPCQCLSKRYTPSVLGTRKNPSQWDKDVNLSGKVLGNISTSGQKVTSILPLFPSFLSRSSVLAWWQKQWRLLWDQVERAERTKGTRASPALSHQANVGAHSSASCYMKNKRILTCVLGEYIILSPIRFRLKNLHFVPSRWLQLRCPLRAPQEKCPLLHRFYLHLSLESDSSHHLSPSCFCRSCINIHVHLPENGLQLLERK